jgi:hypothetical protein
VVKNGAKNGASRKVAVQPPPKAAKKPAPSPQGKRR